MCIFFSPSTRRLIKNVNLWIHYSKCLRAPPATPSSSVARLCQTGPPTLFIYLFSLGCMHQNVEEKRGWEYYLSERAKFCCVSMRRRGAPCVSSPLKLWHHMYEMSLHATRRQMALFSGRRVGWRDGGGDGGEGEPVGHSGCCHDDSGEQEPMAAPLSQSSSRLAVCWFNQLITEGIWPTC